MSDIFERSRLRQRAALQRCISQTLTSDQPREFARSDDAIKIEASKLLAVRLPWRNPYDWNGIANFLEGRATPGVEMLTDGRYLRTVSLNGEAGVIECSADAAAECVRLNLHGVSTQGLFLLVQKVREIFDLDAPMAEIADVLGADPQLAELLRASPGTRGAGALGMDSN